MPSISARVSAGAAIAAVALETAIQAIVSNSPTAAAALQMAESPMAGTGAVLAKAIVAEYPQKFT